MQGGKMAAIINYRVRVTLNDSRALVGQLLAFDKHMNLVLAECDEFRRIKRKGGAKAAKPAGGAEDAAEGEDDEDEMKRTLGLVILRGETIVSLSGAFHPRSSSRLTSRFLAADKSMAPELSSRGTAARIRREGPRRRESLAATFSEVG